MASTALSTCDLAEAVEQYAAALAVPEPPPKEQPWAPQSLSQGTAGIALLHIERAHAGLGTWHQARRWITHAVAGQVSATDTTGLYLGVPAITLMLDAAAAGSASRYHHALTDVDGPVAALAHRRVDAAITRIRSGAHAGFREYDVFFGLTGLGALLLRRDPGGSAMERILDYLVALSTPRRTDDEVVPGWWVGHDPHRRFSADFPTGHGNLGMAHGIAGPLALLSQALRRGITVDRHRDTIISLCEWLETWRQDGAAGPWWPEWITIEDLRRTRPTQPAPARPSWCYGTPGIARAGQLASIATGDRHRQRRFEQALLACLDDPTQQAKITDAGLCHGAGGLYQTVWRAAHDAVTLALADHLPRLANNLAHHARTSTTAAPGFLEGATGTALALHTAAYHVAPTSGWDACLLIN